MNKTIHVAGDVCLDLVGIAVPPPQQDKLADNWRLTGEIRVHYLLGGAMLLADWVEAVNPAHSLGPRPCLPVELPLSGTPGQPLTHGEFLAIAERLKRDEVVHSLLELGGFPANHGAKGKETLRVSRTHGFSGPKTGNPSLKLLPPEDADGSPNIVVLDDTGNRFRRSENQWPSCIRDAERNSKTTRYTQAPSALARESGLCEVRWPRQRPNQPVECAEATFCQ